MVPRPPGHLRLKQPLTPGALQDLHCRYHRSGCVHLRNRLVEAHLNLVRQQAHRFSLRCSIDFDDLVQLGSLGLLNTDGALSKTFDTATPTSSELVDMLELVSLQHVDLNKLIWIVNPAMAANLRRGEISSGSGELILNYDNGGYRLHGVPVAMTTNMPAGKVLLIEPSFTKLVYFGNAEVLVDPYRNATTGQTNVQIFNHVDVAVTYPESVCVGSS